MVMALCVSVPIEAAESSIVHMTGTMPETHDL